jgi:hypothetical protein
MLMLLSLLFLAVAATLIVVPPLLLWWAFAEPGEQALVRPAARPLSFHEKGIWRAFTNWMRSRPPQLVHYRQD